ncbi:MAG: hypothetical protein ABW128_09735 [Rhizorhabdus sp.]
MGSLDGIERFWIESKGRIVDDVVRALASIAHSKVLAQVVDPCHPGAQEASLVGLLRDGL